ncbi:3'(2'),5'-bisphosphate nucleotidase CysQ [Microbacterium sp. GCS4]|uniref:3'(2'),5'-bisphosphate nucleotidase CysQ n=1 Tax=Microbacterium sp. GCS4 TaxID=1692239 RepID=UPI0006818AF2|nr:3'(2'),5'-bisphosphate nucleotidase CysQ [Microbacterium sp. GCS4]KNY05448.1 MFS transporter [Microbacterium sp. GCS4]
MTNDASLAAALAKEAGQQLLDVQRAALPADVGTPALKDRGDRASQELLAARLHESRPDDSVLSEEAVDDRTRLDADRVWIIDPLDGTREFSEMREDWAVHVALWENGDLTAAAVALPALDDVLTTDLTPRDWEQPARIRLAVSRSRATPLVEALAAELDAETVPMGSAGYKACAVIRGHVDAYVHTGGQFEWDSAAPVAVARAAGLFTSRVDGSPLVYNREDPYLPDLIVCNPTIADRIRQTIDLITERPSS